MVLDILNWLLWQLQSEGILNIENRLTNFAVLLTLFLSYLGYNCFIKIKMGIYNEIKLDFRLLT